MVSCPYCPREDFVSEHAMITHAGKAHDKHPKRESTSCAWCGDEIQVKKYKMDETEYQYCSRDCYWSHKSELYEGEGHPHYQGKGFNCEWCGSWVQTVPAQADRRRFCSRECRGAWESKHRVGENNPHWQGGSVNYYGPEWQQQRKRALIRDQYRCQICRKAAPDMIREPDVHHIKPFKEFSRSERANRLSNLITLCASCHKKWEGVPVLPQPA